MRRRAALSHYTDDSGLLSIDFIVGFTIFMISFIFVVTMTSGLLVGLSSKSIDYDSVAYRTGVILAEDPGWTLKNSTSWGGDPNSVYKDYDISQISRLGLAVERDTPNILSQNKVDMFFCSTYLDPAVDYNSHAIFGDFPYRFNITLKTLKTVETNPKYSGDPWPENYGYIRRVVMVKQSPNTIINASLNLFTGPTATYTIKLDMPSVYASSLSPEYQLDPLNEGINISIYNFNSTETQFDLGFPVNATLTRVRLIKDGTYYPPDLTVTYLVNGTIVPPNTDIGNETINLKINQAYFTKIKADQYSNIRIEFIFASNSKKYGEYIYSTSASPSFTPAILEVRIW
jgi:hypothetical protein